MEQDINIIAVVKANEGKREVVREALMAILAPTRAEEGCKLYVLHQDIKDENTFIFYETWANAAAIKAHMESEHFMRLGAAIEGAAELTVYEAKQCG